MPQNSVLGCKIVSMFTYGLLDCEKVGDLGSYGAGFSNMGALFDTNGGQSHGPCFLSLSLNSLAVAFYGCNDRQCCSKNVKKNKKCFFSECEDL